MADDTDFTKDLVVVSGCDLLWAFSLQPFDGTGCSASFVTDFGTFAATIDVDTFADQALTTFTVSIPAASLSSVVKDVVHTWRMLVTFSGGQVLPFGHGGLLIES